LYVEYELKQLYNEKLEAQELIERGIKSRLTSKQMKKERLKRIDTFSPESGTMLIKFGLAIPLIYTLFFFINLLRSNISKIDRTLDNCFQLSNYMTDINLSRFVKTTNENIDTYSQISAEIQEFSKISLSDLFTYNTPQKQRLAIELNSLVHASYYFYKGEYWTGLNWLTNLLITRNMSITLLLEKVFKTSEFQPEAFDSTDFIGQIFAELGIIGKGDEDIKRANNAYNYMKNAQFSVKNRLESFRYVISFITKSLFGFDAFNAQQQELMNAMMNFIDFMERNVHEFSSMSTKEELLEQIVEEYEHCTEYMLPHPELNEIHHRLYSLFMQKYHECGKLYNLAKAYIKGNRRRVEPVFIFISGHAGSGKSVLSSNLFETIHYFENKESNEPLEKMYNPGMLFMLSQDSFFEGYCNQKFVGIADIFTSTNAEERAREATEINKMVSSDPYDLKMAYGLKGMCKFDSAYIVASSNLDPEGKNDVLNIGLTDPAAFKRRISIQCVRSAKMEDPLTDTFVVYMKNEQNQLVKLKHEQNLAQIAMLAVKIRKRNQERFKNTSFTPEKLESLYRGLEVNFETESSDPSNEPQPLFTHATDSENSDDDDETYELKFMDELIERCKKSGSKIYQKGLEQYRADPELRRAFFEDRLPNYKNSDYRDPLRRDVHQRFNPNYYKNFRKSQRRNTEFKKKAYKEDYDKGVKSLKWLVDHAILDYAVVGSQLLIISYLAFVTYGAATNLCSYFFPPSFDDESFQHRSSTKKRKLKRDKKKLKANRVNPESGYHTIGESPAILKIKDSRIKFGTFVIWEVGGRNAYSNGFHYDQGYCFVTHHFMIRAMNRKVKELKIGYLSSAKKFVEQTIPFPSFDVIEGYDLVYFKLPTSCSLPTAIRDYFINLEDIDAPADGSKLETVYYDRDYDLQFASFNVDSYGNTYNYYVDKTPIFIDTTMCYQSPKSPGMSGSILALPFNGTLKIVAVHAGHSNGVGVGMMIDKDSLDELLFSPESNEFPHEILYRVDPSKAHIAPNRTKLIPSDMFEWHEKAKHLPAHLKEFTKDDVKIDPWNIAHAKLHQTQTKCDFDRNLVLASLIDFFKIHNVDPKFKIVLSMNEAINSIPNSQFKAIVIGTSAGYPFSLIRCQGKLYWVHRDANDILAVSEELEKIILEQLERIKNGQRANVLWADILKDETREIAKRDAGKTRLFSASPLDYLIMMRMFFGTFVDYMHTTVLTHPCCVGINAHGFDWEYLYINLNTKKGSVIAGDFSNFDGKLPAEMGEIFLQLVNKFYDDQHGQTRALLMQEIFKARHIHKDMVYEVADGNPSGQFLTAIYNSICQVGMIVSVLAQDLKLRPSEYRIAVYGDDNIITIEKPGLRCSDLTPHFKRRFDMDYTHFSKSDNHDFDTLETINFLGRKFVYRDGRMFAPLDLNTIVESTYWLRTKDSSLHLSNMCDCYRSFQLELVHHGKEVFDFYIKLYFKALKERCNEQTFKMISNLRKEYYSLYDEFYKEEALNLRTNLPWMKNYAKPNSILSNEIYETNEGFTPESSSGFAKQPIPENSQTHIAQTNDRNTNEVVPTQQVQLGNYEDVNEVYHNHDSDGFEPVHTLANFEGFPLNKVLDREYPHETINWSTDDAQDHLLARIFFPEEIFQQDFIRDKIRNFHYFRGNIRITFRVAAARTLYGKFMASWYPMPNTNRFATNLNSATCLVQSGLPHVICSASSASTVIMDIPFTLNTRFYDIQDYFKGEPGTQDRLAMINIKVMNPLTDITGATNKAQILITSQFTDAKVYMPYHFHAESSESAVKGSKGVISSTLDSVQPIASVLESVPFVAPYAKVFKGASSKVSKFAKMFGLSKPNTLSLTDVHKMNPYSDMNAGRGIDSAIKMAHDQENAISTSPDVCYTTSDEMDLQYICCTPALVQRETYVSTDDAKAVGLTALNQKCFLDMFSQAFKYQSGSIRFRFYISASTFHNISAVLWLGTDARDSWADCYHKIIKIEGDTDVEFVVPYISNPFAMTDGRPIMDVYFKHLTWSDFDPALEKPIYINTYKASAGDFQFGVQKDLIWTFNPESCPRDDFKKPAEPVHESFKEYKHDKIIWGEQITTIREVMHRYYATAPVNNTNYLSGFAQNPTSAQSFERFSPFFMFYRGSVNIKILSRRADIMKSVVINTENDDRLIGMQQSSLVNPVLDFNLPWYTNLSFLNTDANPSNFPVKYKSTNTAQNPGFIFKSSGDDFSYHFLHLPHIGSWQLNPNSETYFNWIQGIQPTS
jgi:hypothetical protein